jgi:hypothetical protein
MLNDNYFRECIESHTTGNFDADDMTAIIDEYAREVELYNMLWRADLVQLDASMTIKQLCVKIDMIKKAIADLPL